MNIFRVDDDPVIAAQSLCDKHVLKMIIESAQMLCTAHVMIDGHRKSTVFYKPTHVNHPCNIWIREGLENYIWLYKHFLALCEEYTYRYGKFHMTQVKLGSILETPPEKIINGSSQFRCAIGENIYHDNCVEKYREYYRNKKNIFNMKWTKRIVPTWF